MTEQEAIRRLKRGDVAGLHTLVQNYQAQALRIAYLITFDTTQAEDVVQSAFLRVYERIDQYDPQRPFAPWFLRSVANAAITAARRRQQQTALADVPEHMLGAESPRLSAFTSDPAILVERAETYQELHDALRALTPAQRAALVQRYYLDMSEAAMAQQGQCAPGTIKWRLHAARKHLRAVLTGRGTDSEPTL